MILKSSSYFHEPNALNIYYVLSFVGQIIDCLFLKSTKSADCLIARNIMENNLSVLPSLSQRHCFQSCLLFVRGQNISRNAEEGMFSLVNYRKHLEIFKLVNDTESDQGLRSIRYRISILYFLLYLLSFTRLLSCVDIQISLSVVLLNSVFQTFSFICLLLILITFLPE